MKWDDLTAEERMTWGVVSSVRALGEHAEHEVARHACDLMEIYRRAGRELAGPDAWAMAIRDFLARRRAGSPGG